MSTNLALIMRVLVVAIAVVWFVPVIAFADESKSAPLSIKNTDVLPNDGFKNDVLLFFYYNQTFNYSSEYDYLSDKFISELGANSREEYCQIMSEQSEVSSVVFLKVISYCSISEYLREVIVYDHSVSEGYPIYSTVKYIFIKDKSRWKFDNLSVVDRK